MCIGLLVIRNTFLQFLPLPCPIVQRILPISSCHVLNVGRASSLRFMPEAPLQHMARLAKGVINSNHLPTRGNKLFSI